MQRTLYGSPSAPRRRIAPVMEDGENLDHLNAAGPASIEQRIGKPRQDSAADGRQQFRIRVGELTDSVDGKADHDTEIVAEPGALGPRTTRGLP